MKDILEIVIGVIVFFGVLYGTLEVEKYFQRTRKKHIEKIINIYDNTSYNW